jgi:hypothetical protein
MTVVGGGGIFVSYRRQEASNLAGRLYAKAFALSGVAQALAAVSP